MTNEKAEKILFYHRSTGNLSPMLSEALDLAISALSKHCASSEQADTKLFNRGYWLMPGEVFISHNVLNEVLNTIIKSINTEQRKIDSTLVKTVENDEAIHTDDHIADSDKMVDQFRGITKKTDSERVSLLEQKKSNSFPKKPSENGESEMNCSDVPGIRVGKTDFKSGGNPGNFGRNPGIIRCKDCQYRDPEDKKCDHGHGIVWQLPRPDDWFCADGKA